MAFRLSIKTTRAPSPAGPAPDPWPVRRRLHEARWRLRGAGLVRTLIAMIYGAGAAGTGLLIFYPFARDTRLGLPVLVLSTWLVAGLSVLLALWFFLFRFISDREAAREIEARHPELNGAFSNFVEFHEWLTGDLQPPPGTAIELARAEAERAVAASLSLRIGRLNRWRPVGRFALGMLLPLAVLGLLAGINSFQAKRALTAILTPQQAWAEIRIAFQESGKNYDKARIAGVSVELHYPDYLKLPPATIEATDGTIEAIRGTKAILSIRTLEKVGKARFEFAEGGSSLASKGAPQLTVTGDKEMKAEFTLGTSGLLYVYYKRPWRFGESRTQPFRLTVTDDLAPRAELNEPAGERKTKPGDLIAVRYHASDDHALTKLVLRITGRIVDDTIELKALEPDASSASGDYQLNLGSYDLAGEDEIEIFVEATDDDTISGPKTGTSAKTRLLLRADERELLALLDNQERILAGMIDWLGTNLETYPKPGDTTADSVVKDFLALFKRGEEVVSALDETVTAMRANPLADENATEALSNIHKDLAKQAKRFETAGRSYGLPGTKFTQPDTVHTALTGTATGQVPPLEKHILFLDMLVSKQRLDEALRPREEIDALKNRIRELMEEYKKTGDKKLLEQIRKLTNRLKDLVNRTLNDAARRLDELPDEFVNKTEPRKDMDEMQKLADQLAGEDFDQSMEALENYLNGLDETFDNMDLARSSFAGEAFFKELGKVAELEQKVSALEKEQKEILKEIEKQRGDDTKPPLSAAEQAKLKAGLEQASKLLDEASRKQQAAERVQFQELQQARMAGDFQKMQQIQQEIQAGQMQRLPGRMSGAARQADGARREIDNDNLGAALSDLKALERETTGLSQKAKERSGTPGESGPRSDVQKASQQISEAAKMLEKKLAEAGQNMRRQPGATGQNQRLAERQGRAQKEADKLGKELQQLAEGSPMIPGESGPEMQAAAGEMGESGQQLGQGRPQSALSPGASAGSRLQSIRQGLSEARQRMEEGMRQARSGGQGSGMGMGGQRPGGRGNGRDRDGAESPFDTEVEIPKADENRSRNKDEIINAMKEPAPKSYNPQNRDYYKNLMQN